MEKKIKVTIDKAGKVSLQATGYKGQSCMEATAFIEKAIGTVESRTKTSDFYKKSDVSDQVHNG